MNAKPWLSRRNMLKGLGVAMGLPWLESLSPSSARAQALAGTRRYIFMYFPNGTARDYWPAGGSGADWTLSPIMEPLASLKQYVCALTNVGQTELFGGNPNPSHSQLAAPTWSGTINDGSEPVLGGPTVDQVIASHIGDQTPFPSLQLGLSTMNSYADGQHPAISRSMSWSDGSTPLYKEVNPQAVFDRLMMQLGPGGNGSPEAIAAAELRKAQDLSVLDYVLEDATSLQTRLSTSDRVRLDQFLTSVRELEGRVSLQMPGGGPVDVMRPELEAEYTERNDIKTVSVNSEPEGYSRELHAEVMNDLITLAFQTDMTRVVSHMFDDARSDYHYQFLNQRNFTPNGSTELDSQLNTLTQGDLLGYHALQHDGDSNNGFATVNHWLVSKFASLLERLSTTPDPDGSGKMLIDTTFMHFQSGMQGSNHAANMLPILIAGSGGGVFKTDYHHVFPSEVRLADVHLTVIREGFGLTDVANLGNGTAIVPELLA